MSRIKESKTSFFDQALTAKWPAMACAGAALGAISSHANGALIYTPLNITLDTNATKSATISLPIAGVSGADGKPVFTFTASTTNGVLMSKPSSSGSVAALVESGGSPSLLPTDYSLGQLVFPNSDYTANTSTSTTDPTKDFTLISADGSTGPFTEASGLGYIGFEYNGVPSYHAGWVAFQTLQTTADGNNEVVAQITGIGVESSQLTPIAAGAVPEPTSLGLLAMGAVGLLNYRRRRTA